jgi:hypothetical protein
VRLLAVEGCAALGKLLEAQDCAAHILPVIVNFSQVYFHSLSYIATIVTEQLELFGIQSVHFS